MLSIIKTISLHGLEGCLIEVQVDVSSGIPEWTIVGLPDVSVKEAKERVRTAIKNSGFEFQSKKIIVNLAPANTRKEGSLFDLPIAIGILTNFKEIKMQNLEDTIFVGELSSDGKINKAKGILPICLEAKKMGIKRIILPKENEKEAAIVKDIEVIGIGTLDQLVDYLNDKIEIESTKIDIENLWKKEQEYNIDFSEIKGQENVKRAVEVAAARWSQLSTYRKSGKWKNNDSKKNSNNITRSNL